MRDVVTLPGPDEVADSVAVRFLERISAAQDRGETPHVALTGGTVARLVHRAIAARAAEYAVDWDRVVFWFGDERFVVRSSAERNAGQAREDLLDSVGATRVHEAPAVEDADGVADAARQYTDLVRAELFHEDGVGEFDLVMLGMGPDGHVASLFPGHSQLTEGAALAVPVLDSPKPPPLRVTLTLPALNTSKAVWFLVAGAEKADAVARAWAFDGTTTETPARGITGPSVTWFVDRAAAGG